MARVMYSHEEMGGEVQAPWGYYQPLEEAKLDHAGREVLYTLGSACIEVSCCGNGSWQYARVEGYVVGSDEALVELETIERPDQKAEVVKLVQAKHPGVRVEFR